MAAEIGYVVVSWWAKSTSSTDGTYEYEHYAHRSDAFDGYDEYSRGEYRRAQPIGIFEVRNGMPAGPRLHPAIAAPISSEERAERLRSEAAKGIENEERT